ncbi:hypothetical protein C8J57DRAFT_1716521 [Mycena rebaudengoi]|nr:hypothetical protein C8J57DRAFT_1716521 [Mycena rebaudengoi]
MPTLPPELIDAIVAQLREEYASLNACSLVSNAFVAPAQRRIFRSLWLHTAASLRHPTFQVAAASLAQFPHLSSYIRDLTIDLGASDVELEHSALESALRAAKDLERLMISAMSVMNWKELPYGLRSALRAVVLLPSLQELHLAYVIEVPSDFIFLAASSISFLSTRQVVLDEEGETDFDIQDAPTLRLTHLMIRAHMRSFGSLLLAAPAHIISRLERLTVRMSSGSREYDSRLLTAVAPSLRTLSLIIDSHSAPLDFPHMPLINTFEIETLVISHRDRWLPPEYQTTFAKIAAAFPGIEVLTLAFRFVPEHPEIPWRWASIFPMMGAYFSTRTKLVHLRQIHCKLIPTRGQPDEAAAIRHLRDAMDQWMPGVPPHMVTFSLGQLKPIFLSRLPALEGDV